MSLAPPVPKTPKAFIRSRARTKGGTIRPRSSMEEQLDKHRDMLLCVRLPPKTVGKYKKATAYRIGHHVTKQVNEMRKIVRYINFSRHINIWI